MNVAIIFAGGVGQRMHAASTPKQFLKVYNKPIIIYTLEKFSCHPEIDAIIIACLETHIPFLHDLIDQFNIQKVKSIIRGGATGMESIYNGLAEAARHFPPDTFALIHDGVRPFIEGNVISDNLRTARKYGNAVTVTPAIETVVIKNTDGAICEVIDRSRCCTAKAPQTFLLGDILAVHERARADGYREAIDSASLMAHYGRDLHTVEGNMSNIKITTPQDFYFMRALVDMKEDRQLNFL